MVESGWFYIRKYGKFLKSLYIVGRGVLTPYFMKTSPYCLSLLFQMLPSPPPPKMYLWEEKKSEVGDLSPL